MKASILSGITFAIVALALVTLPAEVGPGGAGPGSVSAGSAIPGDVNCDGTADARDAAWVLQFAAGLLGLLPCAENGDVSGDGNINPLDATLILQFDAGLLSALSSPQPSTSTPTLVPTDTASPTNTPMPPTATPVTPTATPVPAADVDLSGTWDAHYSLTCDAVFDQDANVLSAAVNCGALAAGTLAGSVNTATGVFSLSGQLGAMSVSIDGLIVDDGSLGGTYSAPPLAEEGTFDAVRVDPGSGTELNGEWVLMFMDIFSDGCSLEVEQLSVDLTARLDCELVTPASGVALEGTLDGSAVTLTGPFAILGTNTLLLEGTVSEDGTSIEGTWEITPLSMGGSFIALRGAGGAGSLPPAES